MKKALIDLQTSGYSMVRCPHCNAWDQAMSGARPGIYACDVCNEPFEFDGDESKDTVPEDIRAQMTEAN